jgi:ketosteroid isomerase-like protein
VVSQEDLQRVKDAWRAISVNDFDGFVSLVDPDVEFTSLVAEAEADVYRGHQGVRKWWDSVREAFPDFWADAMDLHAVGPDQILAEIRLCGTVHDTTVEQTIWQLLTVKDSLVIGWTVYRSESEALRAADLSQRDAWR